VRDGATITMLSAGLSVYRIGADGELDSVRKYDVEVGGKEQFWSGVAALAQPIRKYAPTWSGPRPSAPCYRFCKSARFSYANTSVAFRVSRVYRENPA